MRGHITSQELHLVSTGDIEGESLLEIDRHLDACSLCTRRAGELVDLDALAASMHDSLAVVGEHPEMPDLIGYAEGSLDDAAREWVDGHLEWCARCREDVDDLRSERESLREGGRRWWWIAACVLVASAIGAGAMWIENRSMPAGKLPGARVHPVTPVPRADPWSDLEQSVLANGRIGKPAILDSLRPSAETLRGSDTTPGSALRPSGEVIDDDVPIFTWPATPGAHYVVTIFAKGDPVATSELLSAGKWRAPHPLHRGTTYNWQVEVRNTGGLSTILPTPPQPEALFRVVDVETVASIDTARRAHPDDHLLQAILYARAGMKSRGLAELNAHLGAHPSDVRAAALADGIRKW
jgi:hypothetical protein